jgi:hypothetical protein
MITSGAVVLRRRSVPSNWIRSQQVVPGQAFESRSDQIERVFAAEDLLQEVTDDAGLMEKRFRMVPEHRLEPVLHAEGGRWELERSILRQTRGLPFPVEVDRLGSTLAAAFDGQRTLGELVAEVSRESEAAPERVAAACAEAVRNLLRLGFLAES